MYLIRHSPCYYRSIRPPKPKKILNGASQPKHMPVMDRLAGVSMYMKSSCFFSHPRWPCKHQIQERKIMCRGQKTECCMYAEGFQNCLPESMLCFILRPSPCLLAFKCRVNSYWSFMVCVGNVFAELGEVEIIKTVEVADRKISVGFAYAIHESCSGAVVLWCRTPHN